MNTDKFIIFCTRIILCIGFVSFAIGCLAMPVDEAWRNLPLTERSYISAIALIAVAMAMRFD